MKKLIFIRHAKTKGNIIDPKKGIIFLGRKKDYEIIDPEQNQIDYVKEKVKNCSLVFSSPIKRCKQSLELITNIFINDDERLLEIDYGNAEGLYLKEIKEKYSYLFKGWKKGEDPRFPNGENTKDVLNRYKYFIQGLEKYKEDKILVCTHNVFLRTALGYSMEIPMKDWFKISIPYFEPIEFKLIESKLIYFEHGGQKRRILENLK